MLAIYRNKGGGYACGYSREGSGNDRFHGLFSPRDLTWAIGNLKIRLSQVSFTELFTESDLRRKAKRARGAVLFNLLDSDSKELKVRLIEGLCASERPCLPRDVFTSTGFENALKAYVSERKAETKKLGKVIKALGNTHGLQVHAKGLQELITEGKAPVERRQPVAGALFFQPEEVSKMEAEKREIAEEKEEIAEEKEELKKAWAQYEEQQRQVVEMYLRILSGPDALRAQSSIQAWLSKKSPSAFDSPQRKPCSELYFGKIKARGEESRAGDEENREVRASTPFNLPR